ncbi:MAG TPA: DUF748 domain-containing protein [Piscinibacter sp.]|nr:DUF748 domain-containing protein [Piscinibacter sp.]
MSRLGAWPRRLAIALAVLLALWALAWLAVPPLLKSQAQSRLSELLGRSVSIGAVDFRPWSLELTVSEVAIGPAPGGTQALLKLARAYVDADAGSLWRRAPVIAALELDGLDVKLARTSPGHYDIDDLLARFAPDPAAAPAAPGNPPRFALYNLKLRDAAFSFDDRPVARVHKLDAVQVSLPFLSNLPAHLEVTAQPRVAFRLDGTAFDSGAQATPFAARRKGELKLSFADLDLAGYAAYLPASLPLRLQKGALSADLALRFELPEGAEPSVAISGSTGLKNLAVADAAGAPLLGWRQLQIGWRDVQPLARRVALGSLKLDGAELHVARNADGRLNLQALGGPAAPVPAPAASAAASAPQARAAGAAWQASLDQLEIDDARLSWNDASTRPAAALQIEALRVRAKQWQWPLAAPAPMTLSATLRNQAPGAAPAGQFSIDGNFSDREANGTLELSELALAELAPYVAQALLPRLEGRAALKGRFDWRGDAASPRLVLGIDSASLDALRLVSGGGRAARDELAFKQLTLADARLDLVARQIELGRMKLLQPTVAVQRDREGRWNLASLTPPAPAAAAAPRSPATSASAPAWRVLLKDLQLDGGRVQLSDAFAAGRAAETPLRVDASALRLHVQDAAWPGGRGTPPARVQFAARVAGVAVPGQAPPATGSIEWSGRAAPEPLAASGKLRIDRFPVHLFEPYFGDALRLSLLRAEAGWQGDFNAQAAPAGWTVSANGDARLSDVRVHTRVAPGADSSDELLSWQAFTLSGVRFAMAPAAVPQLEIREAALNDFFARLVVTEQGRLNLSSVAAADSAASAAAAAVAASAAAPVVAAASAASAPAAAPSELPIALSVGGVKLANGRVDFSDRFIRPNYSANLTELNGQLGAFRSGTREMATIELRGRAAGTALLDIRGSVNPTADPLALDIQAKATDLELAPLSPYAGKYAGYAIERGKLSMEVAYKISPDGKLEARNQVILNQLTFGDKVDSPDATKLPVLLAVALLRDRNGVIDINLPISGSINDPQFSVFGIVLKVIGNLLVKALTAPFSLLAGGGSEDLSLVEFRPGTAFVTEGGRGALDKVAKALADRESLKMTVTGAADPVSEREAFQRAALEARLLAERRRELLRGGTPAAEADALATLEPETRARVLREVYRATELKNKPRNALGFARDIPGPEMEALLKSNTIVTTDAMRELALQRGLAVRDALLAKGLPGERLFLAAPKLRASGEEDAAWTPRVQLTLGTN